jgi:hypothetical protein
MRSESETAVSSEGRRSRKSARSAVVSGPRPGAAPGTAAPPPNALGSRAIDFPLTLIVEREKNSGREV